MDFQSKKAQLDKLKTDVLILPVYDDLALTASAKTVNQANNNQLSVILKNGDIKGNPGETLMLSGVSGANIKRVLLLGLGKKKEVSEAGFRKAMIAAVKTIATSNAKDACLALDDIAVNNRDVAWMARQIAELAEHSTYTFNDFKSKDKHKTFSLKKLAVLCNDAKDQRAAATALKVGKAVGQGMNFTRDLGNTPPNVCNPTYLAQTAKKMARANKALTTTVIEEKAMREMGMRAFLSVSAGSDTPAKLIVMDYKGGKKGAKPHVLVGKGITFDTGGISLKPAANMDAMKWDMCGAASVFGTMQTIMELELPINVIGVVAAAENMPSGKASRPGDIVKTMSGQTVEILNTDAEGRLVLCDALTYVEKYNPASVIDIATLTGAVIVALGPFASGMMSNNEEVAAQLQSAADTSQDKIWRLPLWDEYQALLDSPFADIGNIGNAGPKAGTITAGCFLSRFTKKYPWAHLDVAGSAFGDGAGKGASGRPVPLLTEYLLQQTKS